MQWHIVDSTRVVGDPKRAALGSLDRPRALTNSSSSPPFPPSSGYKSCAPSASRPSYRGTLYSRTKPPPILVDARKKISGMVSCLRTMQGTRRTPVPPTRDDQRDIASGSAPLRVNPPAENVSPIPRPRCTRTPETPRLDCSWCRADSMCRNGSDSIRKKSPLIFSSKVFHLRLD